MSLPPKVVKLAPVVEKFVSQITKRFSPEFAFLDKGRPVGFAYKVIRGVSLLINKDFDTAYETTVLGKCWVPSSFPLRMPKEQLEVVCHETIHEFDKKRLGSVLFEVMYLMPQVFSVFALLALLAPVLGPGWLACLGFLGFLLPIPSPGRMYLELRGYRMSLMFNKEVFRPGDADFDVLVNWVADQFTTGAYYFMFPFRKYIIKLLKDESYKSETIYFEILEWLRTEGLAQKPEPVLPQNPAHFVFPT